MKERIKTKISKGSALVFSLMILFIILAIALGLMSVAVKEIKMSQSTAKSVEAFQVADSGAELFMKSIKGASTTAPLTSFGCVGTSLTGPVAGGTYKITFQKLDGSSALCTESLATVDSIKSVGTYGQTMRAVDMTLSKNSSFNLVQSNSIIDSNTVTLNNVGAGHLIVAWLRWEATSGNASVTDGSDSFTIGNRRDQNSNDFHSQFAYLLVSSGGNKTYTVTFPGGATYRNIIVAEFSYLGTASFDQQSVGGADSGTAILSGNITTTGTNELAIGAASNYYPSSYSNQQINDTNADDVEAIQFTDMWMLTPSATGTMHAQATSTDNRGWICNIISFKTN